MKVRLDRLDDEPYAWHETLAITKSDLKHPDVLALSETESRGRLTRTSNGFLLDIKLSYEQTLACTRCLGEIRSPAETRLDLLVLVEGEDERESAEERELAEDDLGVLVLADHHLDTRPLIVEQMQLNVPMKSLCRDDCAGLCPECGADLNAGECPCRPAVDPRWSALGQWKEKT